MNNEEQYSPFTRKGPQITPLSSLSLRGADHTGIATPAYGGLAMTERGLSLRGGRRSFSRGGRRGNLNLSIWEPL